MAADSILTSLPVPKSRHKYALYAILKTQSDYKNYRPLSDKSLILFATNYFGIKHKSYHSAMAWYSLGCSYTDTNNDLAAIDAYLKAKDLFPDTLVRYYALTEQNLGKHYLNRMMLPEATEQFRCCLSNAIRLKNVKMQQNATYNLGCCALFSKNYSTADSIFSNILAEKTYSSDQKNMAVFQLSKIKLHHEKEFFKALELINQHLHYINSLANSGAAMSVKADIFKEMGLFDSAYHYYEKSLCYSHDINTLCSGYDNLTLMAIILGRKDEAIKNFFDYKISSDSIYEIRNHDKINIIESEHRTELAENNLHYKTIRFTIITIALVMLFMLTAILAVTYYKNWKKEKIWRIRDSINQTESEILRKKLIESDKVSKEDSNQTMSEKRLEIIELYKKELKECCQLFWFQDASSLLNGKTAIRDVELIKEEKVQIIKALNYCFRPVLQFLTNEIPDINRGEAYVCILSYMGYNSVQISRILDVTDACIRQRRKRAQEKGVNDLTNLFFNDTI